MFSDLLHSSGLSLKQRKVSNSGCRDLISWLGLRALILGQVESPLSRGKGSWICGSAAAYLEAIFLATRLVRASTHPKTDLYLSLRSPPRRALCKPVVQVEAIEKPLPVGLEINKLIQAGPYSEPETLKKTNQNLNPKP